MIITLRSLLESTDFARLSALDTSFITERIYRLVRNDFCVSLIEEDVAPLHKTYPFRPDQLQEREAWSFTAIAEDEGVLAGFLAAQHTEWNRRVVLQHLYVMPDFRRQGTGTSLLAAVNVYAQSVDARCVWLETQNVNYPAIQFYRHHGFRFCGFDESLYDSTELESDEIALFFARPVSS